MKPRYAKKVDENQNQIVKALRKIPGVSVELDHDDILVGHQGRTYWFELKKPDAVSKKTGQVRESEKKDSQKRLEKEYNGHYRIVWSLDQILEEIGILVA